MSASSRTALAAVALVAVGVVALALVLRPSSQPSPVASAAASAQPSDAAGRARFASAVHGISIDHPADWRVRAASEPWAHTAVTFDAPGVDVISHPTLGEDLYLAIVSEPLRGKAGSDWVDASLLQSVGICTEPSTGGAGGVYTLDGAEGFAGSCGSHSAGGHSATVPAATRGYIVHLHVADEPILRETFDWDWFEALLRTAELRPGEAVPPAGSASSPAP